MTSTLRVRGERAEATPSPRRVRFGTPRGTGLIMALVSGAAFGTSGTFGDGLLRAGWSPGAAVLARITVAAVLLTPFAAARLRAQRAVLRRGVRQILAYGLIGVLGCTFCYFYAIESIPVGVGLLLEYTAAIMVVGWLWARHGQRPRLLTILGTAAAIGGLALMAGVTGSGGVSMAGFGWGLLAAVCMTVFMFICDRPQPPSSPASRTIPKPAAPAASPGPGAVPAPVDAAPAPGAVPAPVDAAPGPGAVPAPVDAAPAPGAVPAPVDAARGHAARPEELSPVVLSWAGICVAAVTLAVLGTAHVVPMAATTADVTFLGHQVSWLLPVLAVGSLSTAAGFITAVAAVRSLGPKLASFVGMSEVLFAAAFAWLMLGQVPTATQFAGSALILAGVICVRADER